MQDCRTLPPDCLEPIISFTSPLDACRCLCDHPVLIEDGRESFSLHKRNSRFPESAELLDAYLVFKLAAGVYGFTNEPLKATVQLSRTEGLQRTVFLHAEDEDVQNDYQYPIERGDGWLELDLGEFFIEGGEDGQLEIRIFHFNGSWKSGVIIEGIEIRPN
ncbi:hypothetical protein SLE2022_056920 [Rubroshorea leprosula]